MVYLETHQILYKHKIHNSEAKNTNIKIEEKVADSWENCGFSLLSISHGSVATCWTSNKFPVNVFNLSDKSPTTEGSKIKLDNIQDL